MEGKNESVSMDMLCEKHTEFEGLFEVPDAEGLSGCGWLISWQKLCSLTFICFHHDLMTLTDITSPRIDSLKKLAQLMLQLSQRRE
jgi:hypothetical protein